MLSSCYETLTLPFRRLRLRRVSRTKVTLPDTSAQLPGFLLAWLAIDLGLDPVSFLIAPRTLEANNSARTYRITAPSSKTHSSIFAIIASLGKQRRVLWIVVMNAINNSLPSLPIHAILRRRAA